MYNMKPTTRMQFRKKKKGSHIPSSEHLIFYAEPWYVSRIVALTKN